MFSRLKIALTIFLLTLPAFAANTVSEHTDTQYDIHHRLENGTMQHHEPRDLKEDSSRHHNETHHRNETEHHQHHYRHNETHHSGEDGGQHNETHHANLNGTEEHHHHHHHNATDHPDHDGGHHNETKHDRHSHTIISLPTPTTSPRRRLRRSAPYSPIPPSASTSTSLCPPTSANASTQRTLFHEFLSMLSTHDYAGALAMHVADNVTQHDPRIGDGSVAWLHALTEPGATHATVEIVHDLFDNGLGITHSRVEGGNGTKAWVRARADFYRFEGTCIVEHWDVVQGWGGSGANAHPMF